MKNLKIGLVLFLGVLVSSSAMATGALKIYTVPTEKGKAVVNVLEAPDNPFEITVKDSDGKVVYTDREDASTYNSREVYDFSDLPNGKYTFDVMMGDKLESNKLLVDNGNIQIFNQEEELSPDFKLDGKYLEFTFPNTTEANARLLLYDKNDGQWVYQESFDPQFDIQQTLNLSELSPGNYKAVVISGKDKFDYQFNLD